MRDNEASPAALERLLAILGALAGFATTVVVWVSVSYYQPMWPLPGLYFLEIVAFSIIGALAFNLVGQSGKAITWAAVGILGAFSLLGAMSVGFFYLPVTLLLGVPAFTYDVRNRQPILTHLGVCLLCGVVQAALMLAVIRSR